MRPLHKAFVQQYRTLVLLIVGIVFSVPLHSNAARETPGDTLIIPETATFLWEHGSKTIQKETLLPWFRPSTRISLSRNSSSEAIDPDQCPFDLFLCAFSLPLSDRYSATSKTSFSLKKDELFAFVDILRIQNQRKPIDAVFSVQENGSVSAFSPSREGAEIDTHLATRAIEASLASNTREAIEVKLPERILQPKVSVTDADRLGITQFLGEGRTNFAGSPKNRIFNIKRAIEQFQGILIAPKEEFSFVEHLGEVDGEHGYLPELVIKRGKTEPEFGGGICQVSTTFFRAALNTGQKITERRNHAYPVHYYRPYGMDATVYVPRPDFKFRNETTAFMLVQIVIEGTDLVVRLYGTSDGRIVSIDGPHVTERLPDGSMKTTFTQKVLSADGSTIFEDIFRSSYDSPSKYPHPGDERPTEKPDNWSKKQWDDYRRTGALPR